MKPAYCPGSWNLRTPQLRLKRCPRCGAEVEMFSDEVKTDCRQCGLPIYQNLQSCVRWCRYARECLGEELYKRLLASDPEN
jgi:hypothetical protein